MRKFNKQENQKLISTNILQKREFKHQEIWKLISSNILQNGDFKQSTLFFDREAEPAWSPQRLR